MGLLLGLIISSNFPLILKEKRINIVIRAALIFVLSPHKAEGKLRLRQAAWPGGIRFAVRQTCPHSSSSYLLSFELQHAAIMNHFSLNSSVEVAIAC